MARAIVNIPTSGHIGDVKSAMLSLAQFQVLNGSNWILADGSSAAGTAWASITGLATIPDLRGIILRGKNNGRSDGNQDPDGERVLGSFQTHAFESHNHGGGDHLHNVPFGPGTFGSSSGANTYRSDAGTHNTNSSGAVIATQGSNETRMKNVTVNHFIKVN